MHIPGNSMNIQEANSEANSYTATQEERTADARRSAAVRKKLQRKAQEIEAGATPEEASLISQWLDARHSQP